MLARLIAAALLLALPSLARAEAVDLLLVMAVDVSRSIDAEEARMQREGYTQAWRSAGVARAATSGDRGRIAVAYVEWAGTAYQRIVLPWRVIASGSDAEGFADDLAAAPRDSMSWTAVGAAIDFSVQVLEASPHTAPRRVIDISGDGRTNQGRSAAQARDEAVAKGIVINGLPIVNDRANFGRAPERDLDRYFENEVIGGPGAFMIVAESFEAFGDAILSKLIKEIAAVPAPRPSLAAAP